MYECHCLIESAWRLAGSAKKMKTGTTQECKTRRSTTTGSAAALEDEVRVFSPLNFSVSETTSNI